MNPRERSSRPALLARKSVNNYGIYRIAVLSHEPETYSRDACACILRFHPGGGYDTEIFDDPDTVLGQFCGGTENPAGCGSSAPTRGSSGNARASYSATGYCAEHCATDDSCVIGDSNGSRACDSSSDNDCDAPSRCNYGSPPDHDWATYANHDEGGWPNGDAGHARCELRDDPSFSHHCSTARFTTGAAECSFGTAVYRCSRGIGCSEYEHGFDQHEFKRCEPGGHKFNQPGWDRSEPCAARKFAGCSELATPGESGRGSNPGSSCAPAARSHSRMSSGHGPK